MLVLRTLLFVCISLFSSVLSIVPTLSVHKIDNKIIEKKRQDTLEICKLFNEENEGITFDGNIIENRTQNSRVKRSTDNNQVGNPILKKEDIARVESIVDRIYDDLEERGQKISYRRRDFVNETNNKISNNKQHRRFNFAPAELYGAQPELRKQKQKTLQLGPPKIPWIKKWKHGIVPFFIDSNTYDSILADTIIKAFDYVEKVTCIRLQRLRERPTDKLSMQAVEWLYITNPSGVRQCVHSNERKPNMGVQMVVLGYDCLSQGEIAHEIMHILGFPHEHTRLDRDLHITIQWDNIKSGYKKYFQIREEQDPLLNLPYDFASVLHYPPRAFSKNGQLTIKAETHIKIGQREALSEIDVEKIRLIYGVECVERNKDYLLKTCPRVGKENTEKTSTMVTEEDIDNYFKDKVWPYGIVNYKIKDKMEFTSEERENIKSVLDHIEKETCIEFRDIEAETKETEDNKEDEDKTSDNKEDKSSETNQDHNTDSDDKKTKQNFDIFNSTVPNFDNGPEFKPLEESDSNNEVLPSVTSDPNVILTKSYDLFNGSDSENNANHLRLLKFRTLDIKSNNSRKGFSKETTKRIRIAVPISPSRRHAVNVMVLVRSSKPGCECPNAGRPNGNKELVINSDCFNSVNDLLHLFVHILGLDHQHNMHDRDSYLHVIWENLTPEIKKEMDNKLPPAASAGFAYDYQSVMHYPWLQIKDGVTNIMYPVWNDGWAMGHWQGLSWTDVQKINRIYKEECKKRKSETNK